MKKIDQKFYCSHYYDVGVTKYGFKCGTSLRIWEHKGWINEIDPYGWFQWYFRYWLGRSSENEEWKKIVSKFRSKLIKIFKVASNKYNYYSIFPKIRQILLHLGCELTEKYIYF